jgi:hypothetical protein
MNDEYTVIPLPVWFVFLVALLFSCQASAEPLYQTKTPDGTVITLYSESCALSEVSNLSKRATWQEANKQYEGCWGVSPFGLVMFYFDDKSVAVVPAEAFRKVTGV